MNTVRLGSFFLFTFSAAGLLAQQVAQSPSVVSVEQLFRRNIGTKEQQLKPFQPHKIIANVYYVGSESLASFLISTPQGLILINSSYEGNVPGIRASVEQLGFRFSDVKILLGSHAHADHMEGDVLVKQQTGAQVMAMDLDIPALEKIRPQGKPHPVDRVLHDGDKVTLGGTTLTAVLTPGHTPGCTTWTMKATEGDKSYNVVIVGSVEVNPNYNLVSNPDSAQLVEQYRRSFKILRALPCDIPLASHPAMYGMTEKFAKLGKGANPYIDPAGYQAELNTVELAMNTRIQEQKEAEAKKAASR